MPEHSLKALGLVDAPAEPAYDNLTRLAATMLAAPVALVSIIDPAGRRQFFKSQFGLPEPWVSLRETPLSHSFCRHVVEGDKTFIVGDATRRPGLRDNPVIDALGVIAYLGVPVRAPSGQPLGALCVTDRRPRDWTDADVETLEGLGSCVSDTVGLRSALNASESLRTEQIDFAYALSHDLRSPIDSLRAILEELESDGWENPGRETRELLQSGIRTATRASTLIDDVLGYAQSIGRDFVIGRVDLDELVREVRESLSSDIADPGAQVEIGPLPTINGNAVQLQVLMRNLLANAIRFRRPGAVARVHVSARQGSGYIEIDVRDEGIGIAAEHHERIFGLFQRLHVPGDYAGSGLGLPICRRIASNHGGTLALRSSPGKGSTFTLCLPLSP